MFKKILSVTQITDYIKRIFNADAILSNVSIRGELSNFKHHYSGHMYFTLKDDTAKIKCVMFKSSCSTLKFYPEDGMNVIVSGYVSIYERDGQYQLYVNDMQPDGKGALYVAFEQLKKKLESEGLFDVNKKKPLPKYPSKIGVVTSSTGAAIRDIINVATRRFPGINILVVPVMVQGNEAPGQIARAIEILNERGDVDIIITGRGGGSIEELWAFNEECVVRAIFNSSIPVVSAVGHETDYTIADFVSDLRAPTPSAASEICVPDKRELLYKLNNYSRIMHNQMQVILNNKKYELSQQKKLLYSLSPISKINQRKQYIDSLSYKLISLINHKIDMKKELLGKYMANLESLSPLSVLSRGYSVAYKSGERQVLRDIKNVKCGDNVDVYIKNGCMKCKVEAISEEELCVDKVK